MFLFNCYSNTVLICIYTYTKDCNIRNIVTPIVVPIAYPTTPHTVAAIVMLRLSIGLRDFFISPQNAAAVAGPPIAALLATSISVRSIRVVANKRRNIYDPNNATMP